MSRAAISIEHIAKRYKIGGPRDSYLSLREEVARWASLRSRKARAGTHIWALRDVSFEVNEGEAVGIIGRNGAGKSTLLKVLSRITPPTEGKVTLRGRVASLLEVGTGFHPELTGRENVYLNGAILGMTRREIARRFDEIVAFAEVEKFLDTPVKRYSSGMFVRLAFAVAAHLEPEILLVDEVLAVGDAEFQRKCLGKMNEVTQGGRTVLFVSHNMAAVSQLCAKGVVLVDGQLDYAGPAEEAIRHYTDSTGFGAGRVELASRGRAGDERAVARFRSVTVADGSGAPCSTFFIGDEMLVSLEVEFCRPVARAQVGFIITSTARGNIYHCSTADSPCAIENASGPVAVTARFPELKLYPGTYVLSWLMLDGPGNEVLDLVPDSISFQVAEGGRGLRRPLHRHAGVVHEVPDWVIGRGDSG